MKSFANLLLAALIIATASCATLNPFGPGKSTAKSSSDKPALPFSLEISDEVNDGDRLHILGTVSASADWDLKDVLVKLSSISGGQTIGISYLPLTHAKQKLQQRIKADEKYTFTISVPSKDITDYQLELLWGEDAKHYLSTVHGQSTGVLEIRNIQIETIRQPCQGVDCMLTFRAKAILNNSTNKTVNKVVLGIGFIRLSSARDLDLTTEIPQNEDKIDVGQIMLLPGASREIVINFDQEVPEKELKTADGELKPTIRIISFTTK